MKLLRPTRAQLVVFASFLLMLLAACVQAWGFSKVGPKPPLYDVLTLVPFWLIMMYLLTPLALLVSPLEAAGIDVMGSIAVQVLYFYLLSCVIVAGVDWWRQKARD